MHFTGTFDYAMDDRGRVPIPPRYRDAFREGVVLGQGSPDTCVRLYTPGAWEQEAARYLAQSPMRRKGRDLRRGFFSRTEETKLDAQHRVLIPSWLRDYGKLSKKVLLLGVGEWMELWDPGRHQEELARLDERLEEAMESVEDWQR